MRGFPGGARRRARARQQVAHDALLDAYLLRGALEDVEHQGDEPQQHQLCTSVTRIRIIARHVLDEATEMERRTMMSKQLTFFDLE